jgi:hypothetical protein
MGTALNNKQNAHVNSAYVCPDYGGEGFEPELIKCAARCLRAKPSRSAHQRLSFFYPRNAPTDMPILPFVLDPFRDSHLIRVP